MFNDHFYARPRIGRDNAANDLCVTQIRNIYIFVSRSDEFENLKSGTKDEENFQHMRRVYIYVYMYFFFFGHFRFDF